MDADVRFGLRVLSISCVYPNPGDAALGLFVRSRLMHLSRLAEVKVVAPIARIDYARSNGRSLGQRGIALRRWDETIEVFHPAWIYPPGGHSLNAMLLFLRLWPLAARIRKTFDFQIIDAHFAFPDGIAAALLSQATGVPFTVTLRGNETMHAQHRQRRKLIAWSLRRAGRVIAVSERLRQFALQLGVESERAKTIPNGIDPALFYPRDRALCRREHGLPTGASIVLSAGSLIERKGHHRVARAVAALRQDGVDVHLVIAGGAGREGHYEGELRRLIEELSLANRVHLLGEVSPRILAEVMSASDLLCLASTREGWPNVVHEAMACGTPVVATDVGAVADMIPSPEFGSVVPAGDSLALEQAIREALTRVWDRQSISALAHSRTWERVAREVFSELEHAAADGARRSRKP